MPQRRDTAPEVVWHDLECGGYRADVALWHELAAASPTDRILEIGAGTGRVTLELARAGHRVTALDTDGRLLDALSARAAEMDVEVVCVRADARSFDLGGAQFGLCLVPMQTVQLLGGTAGRAAFMRRVRAHLRPGAVLACAIVSAFDYFDSTRGEPAPAAETARVGGVDYVSRAIRVLGVGEKVVIERTRRILPPGGEQSVKGSGLLPRLRPRAPETAGDRDLIELDRVTAAQLEQEAVTAGLQPTAARTIEATVDYVASTVVMLRA
jgi:SAM-dependent methyltransferase